MKTFFLLSGIICFTLKSSFCQPIPVKGSVKIATGYPVAGVTVKAKEERREILTDSAGNFFFKVSPYSVVQLSYDGYTEIDLKITDKPVDTVIILSPENVNNQPDETFVSKVNNGNFQTAISTGVSNTTIYGGSINSSSGTFFPQFTHKEETQGSRYLFNGWTKGSVVDSHDTVIRSPSFSYNYDKVNGVLLFTLDKQSAVAVEHAQVKSFTLFDQEGNPMLFRYIPKIGQKLFVNVLAEGENYNFYKLTKTKFIKSNYQTDGMTSTGNPYDEYTDEVIYFIENVKTQRIEKISLKRKALRLLLADQKEKTDRYFSDHRDEAADQQFVQRLIDFVNKRP